MQWEGSKARESWYGKVDPKAVDEVDLISESHFVSLWERWYQKTRHWKLWSNQQWTKVSKTVRGITVGSERRKIEAGVPDSLFLQSFKGKRRKLSFSGITSLTNSHVKENPNIYIQLFLACIFIHWFCSDTGRAKLGLFTSHVSSSMKTSVFSLPRLLFQVSDT